MYLLLRDTRKTGTVSSVRPQDERVSALTGGSRPCPLRFVRERASGSAKAAADRLPPCGKSLAYPPSSLSGQRLSVCR